MLIASVEPFVAFLADEGLARFCVEDYQLPDSGNSNNDGIHLTNYSLNKHNKLYCYSEQIEGIHNGTKRTLKSYWASVKQEGHNIEKVFLF